MAVESWVAERAREELELLETNHPGRFDYLKLELAALIALHPCSNLFYVNDDAVPPLPSFSVPTQVSSSKKRKAEDGTGKESGSCTTEKKKHWRMMDRVDRAIEKAEACLISIRQVKQSFLPRAKPNMM